jgi:hypothetical protein
MYPVHSACTAYGPSLSMSRVRNKDVLVVAYEGVSKSFRTDRLKRELQIV